MNCAVSLPKKNRSVWTCNPASEPDVWKRKKLAESRTNSNPTPLYESGALGNTDPEYIKNPPGRSVRDADVNPVYPIDRKNPELTPASSNPEPTVLDINNEPVNKLSSPDSRKFVPLNVIGAIVDCRSAGSPK